MCWLPALRDKLTYQPGAPTSLNGYKLRVPAASDFWAMKPQRSLFMVQFFPSLHLTLETFSLAATSTMTIHTNAYPFLLKRQSNYSKGFPNGSDDKDSACNAVDPSLIPGSGRSPGEGHGYPL